jgi:hypothetical protein
MGDLGIVGRLGRFQRSVLKGVPRPYLCLAIIYLVEYVEVRASTVLPQLEAKQLGEFLELGKAVDSVTWPDEALRLVVSGHKRNGQ